MRASPQLSDRQPGNMFSYVMQDSDKPMSFKRSWKPDWRLPPGVKQGKVFMQLAAILGLAAIPVWGLPYLRAGKEGAKQEESYYVTMKKRNKEERAKWIQSDDMPYK